jgi:hypothetical protein
MVTQRMCKLLLIITQALECSCQLDKQKLLSQRSQWEVKHLGLFQVSCFHLLNLWLIEDQSLGLLSPKEKSKTSLKMVKIPKAILQFNQINPSSQIYLGQVRRNWSFKLVTWEQFKPLITISIEETCRSQRRAPLCMANGTKRIYKNIISRIKTRGIQPGQMRMSTLMMSLQRSCHLKLPLTVGHRRLRAHPWLRQLYLTKGSASCSPGLRASILEMSKTTPRKQIVS